MNLPVDFARSMRDMLKNEYDAFIATYENAPLSALRINTRKSDVREIVRLLNNNEGAEIPGNIFVPWENSGIYYNDTAVSPDWRDGFLSTASPGKSPYHAAGLYYIQEPSAMLPATLLDADDLSFRVLDLCAAPGGKTTQIADKMRGRGLLIANEISSGRARILSENIERMGVANAVVISADPKDISERFEGFFDRVLVDAPCSGEGMFRKRPEVIGEWSLENVRICAERQSYILDCAANMLKRGGRLVYSTCTFNDKEDEGSVNDFLSRHPEFSLEGDVHRIYPHKERGEGHFGAVFVKEGESFDVRLPKLLQPEKSIRKEEYGPFLDFARKVLTRDGIRHIFGVDKESEIAAAGGIFIMFGEQLYYAPGDTPKLKGLKVLRPGLHLGRIIKGRFEPSHALALFLAPSDVKITYELMDGYDKYLRGESINVPAERTVKNGWTLMLISGYSLGWGKASGAVIKNHYPKGLRKF